MAQLRRIHPGRRQPPGHPLRTGDPDFETYTRNTLDLSIVPAVKETSHLPIIVDPSHGTGRLSLVEPMCLAALAAGADGLMVEVHHKPGEAVCDKDQALSPEMFSRLMGKIKILRDYLNLC